MQATALRARDYDRLLDVVGSLQGAADLDDLRRRAVHLVPSLVATDRIAWNEIDPANGTIAQLTVPAVDLADGEAIFARTAHSHPVLRHSQRTGDGRPRAVSDFLSASAFHATPIYREFYRHIGAEDQIAFRLPKPDLHVAMALNRSRRGFSQRDRHLLNRLRPQLVAAYGRVVTVTRLRAALAAAESALERHNEGIVLVDQHGMAELVSPTAATLLQRWLPSGADRASLVRSFADDHGERVVVLHGGTARLVVQRLDGADIGRLSLLVREIEADPDPEDLLRRCGLSPREAEVLGRAVRGHENRSIAAELFIGVRTVESHMRRALDKLGVANRTEAGDLVRRLLAEAR